MNLSDCYLAGAGLFFPVLTCNGICDLDLTF